MYYTREIEHITSEYLKQFRIIGIMGPRQSGKSTMIKHLLNDSYTYITFDNLEHRHAFYDDPNRFLKIYNSKIIFDEAQQIPELFPALKQLVDESPEEKGRFVLTGSGQFLLSKNISESLAGRIGLVSLLPMQYSELSSNAQKNYMYRGGYPEIALNTETSTSFYFNSYFNTYLQKDLRQMLNITDISKFSQFVRMLATRVGQILNLSDISKETGISVTTLSRWLSVLESSFIIYLLRPFHTNLGKRLVKTPKLYFYDTGLLCFLLGINSEEQWVNSLAAGAIFENMIIIDTLKKIYHQGLFSELYFFRTNHGDEIDLIVDHRHSIDAYEIKMSHTYKQHFHKTLEKTGESNWNKTVIYMGEGYNAGENIFVINYLEFLNKKMKV